MHNFLNPEFLISSFGYVGVFLIIFFESGFFFAFFFPGDTLLFTVGFLASGGILNIWFCLIGLFVVTYVGSFIGYLFGRKIGDKIFFKKGSFLFDPENLERTRIFYKKYGKWAIVLCRFVPIVRTFTPIMAGVGNMKLKTFLKYNILGSMLWPPVLLFTGYFFGSQLPSIRRFVMPVILGFFIFSLILIFWAMLKKKKRPKSDEAKLIDISFETLKEDIKIEK